MNQLLRLSGLCFLLLMAMRPVQAVAITGGHGLLSAWQNPLTNPTGDGPKLERPAKTVLCPGSDAITLKAPELSATYTWYWNGTAIRGLNTNTQTVSQPGGYYALIKYTATGEEALTDTITLTKGSNPTATLTAANPTGILCERDSLRLTAGGGLTYQWFVNNSSIPNQTGAGYVARQPGRYSVTAIDTNGCRATSGPLNVTLQTRPKPVIDSVPPVCGTDGPLVGLRASPTGGMFGGPGVSNASFDPKKAGFGMHILTYQSPPANGCAGDSCQRLVRVNTLPTVELAGPIITGKQRVVSLEPTVIGSGPFQYLWRPTTWLNSATKAIATVTFPQHDTTYTVRVQDVFGCTAEASVRLLVKSQVSIPDAFTPNGDQVNDDWKLPGIESYPQAQVTVFNKWGNVVFHSQNGYLIPFSGQTNGEPLPAGVYLYVLKLSPDSEPRRGSVLLVR